MKQELVFDAPRRGMPPQHLADLDEGGRAAAVAELGLPAFRGKQLANQYYGRLIADPHQMTDLPAAVRDQVADALFPPLLTTVRQIECDAGETRKTLWRAGDGTTFESVLMRYPQRSTVCISSQAGCGMACPFCATGQGGLTRNLSTGGDPRAGAGRGGHHARRARRTTVEHRLHGHGRTAGQLQPGTRRGPTHHRRPAARLRHLRAVGHGVDGRPGPGHPQARRRAPRCHAGAVAARARRRVARHAGARQQPVERGRSARRRKVLRRCRPAGGCRSSTR